MADEGDGGGLFWLLLIGVAAWLAYDKWWKDDELPPPPTYFANPRPTGLVSSATNATGTKYFVIADSVKGGQADRMGWVLMDHATDKTRPQRTSKELYIVNCTTGAYRNPSFAAYDKKGEVEYSWDESDDDKAKVRYAVPETIGGGIVKALCNPLFDPPAEKPATPSPKK